MGLFERILVVVDGSQTSDYAVGASLTLSREDRSPIVFCVTVDPELTEDTGMAAFGEIAVGRCRQLLDEALARAEAAGLADATGLIVRDDPVRGIVTLARERSAGLIVLGAEPRVGLLRPFMRGLAHGILRETTIPLCVVRRPAIGYLARKILVPIVDDALSRIAIDYALTLARNFASKLLFCTLDEDPGSAAVARTLVENAAAYARSRGLEAESFLLPPQRGVSQTIVHNAFTHGCDAVVMATHMREGLTRLREGSVTEAVIYSSNTPVVVVRTPSPIAVA